MKKTVVMLNTTRTCYNFENALEDTITVEELIEVLKQYPSDARVIYSNDNGYTYGTMFDQHVTSDTYDMKIDFYRDEITVGSKFIVSGWAYDIIDWSIDEVEEKYKNILLTAIVEVLQEPNETGWVLCKIDHLFGEDNVVRWVDSDYFDEKYEG